MAKRMYCPTRNEIEAHTGKLPDTVYTVFLSAVEFVTHEHERHPDICEVDLLRAGLRAIFEAR